MAENQTAIDVSDTSFGSDYPYDFPAWLRQEAIVAEEAGQKWSGMVIREVANRLESLDAEVQRLRPIEWAARETLDRCDSEQFCGDYRLSLLRDALAAKGGEA